MSKYIDADALMDSMKKASRELDIEYIIDVDGLLDAVDKTILKCVDEMPAADVEPVREWISCNERLPEDGEKVLVYWERLDRKTNTVYGFIDILYRTSERGWYCEGRGELNWNAIAWMPLPPVPVL